MFSALGLPAAVGAGRFDPARRAFATPAPFLASMAPRDRHLPRRAGYSRPRSFALWYRPAAVDGHGHLRTLSRAESMLNIVPLTPRKYDRTGARRALTSRRPPSGNSAGSSYSALTAAMSS